MKGYDVWPSVCLIIPPSAFLLDERVFPFLGILKMGAVLEAAQVPVEVLDLSGIVNYEDVVRRYVSESTTWCFGLTATTPQFPAAVRIAQAIRTVKSEARIIIGGTHATLVVAACRYEQKENRIGRAHGAYAQLEKAFDVVVAGDGEEAIFIALGDDPPQLIDGDSRQSPLFLTNARLDETPFPARHLIDLPSYRYSIGGVRATSLIAQLGCPYKCGFCAGRLSPMLRNIRTRSDENIIAEMLFLYQEYGFRGFMLYDDELNVNPNMVALMHKIAQAGRDIGVSWTLRGFIKSERFTDAQASAMYDAGFREILVGFESGSPRILQNIQKIATREDNTQCVGIAHRHGLRVKALMSLGHPGESEETIRETREWLIEVRPSDFDVTIITPYPGSPYYDQAVPFIGETESTAWIYTCKNGDRLFQEDVDYTTGATHYKGDPNDGYVSHVWTDVLDRKTLVACRNALERDARSILGIEFPQSRSSTVYEHSMGQSMLPSYILRESVA